MYTLEAGLHHSALWVQKKAHTVLEVDSGSSEKGISGTWKSRVWMKRRLLVIQLGAQADRLGWGLDCLGLKAVFLLPKHLPFSKLTLSLPWRYSKLIYIFRENNVSSSEKAIVDEEHIHTQTFGKDIGYLKYRAEYFVSSAGANQHSDYNNV